ncbi:alpha/beta fold hydrolase [Nocardia inohanensis]|uniref:alpha/beta fold hydrolase n=1 Tax=Nocardia inohanensis TaxID=209246 RepID=UPI00082FEC70|nr:alpha/beta fold hydrolase [Nocardia inohanensis]
MRPATRSGIALAALAVTVTLAAPARAEAGAAPALDSIEPCPAGTSGHPILMIHGTNATLEKSLGPTYQALLADGRCVYGPDYDSSRALAESTGYFTAVAERILAVNDAASIDLVGKSQGGLIARAVSLELAQRPSNPVRRVISVSGPQRGIDPAGSAELGALALRLPGLPPAMHDMIAGSEFLTGLDRGQPAAPGVRYTMIGTRSDQIVTPYTRSFLDAPNVENVTLQDGCPEDLAGHLAESTDPRTIDLTLHALDPDRHPEIRCQANDDTR